MKNERYEIKDIVSIENSREMLNSLDDQSIEILKQNLSLKSDIERGGNISSSGYRSLITVASLDTYDEVEWGLLAHLDEENMAIAEELMFIKKLTATEECAGMVNERFGIDLDHKKSKSVTIEF
ncbi:MAG: hypothetical protein ACK5LZ_04805 [Anaerorhabdus sp.]